MTIRELVYFTYDGINSQDLGISNISLSDGLYEESLIPDRNIREVKVSKREKPYFQGMEADPLQFDLRFMFDDTWDDAKIKQVAKWLHQDYYKPLCFNDNPNRIFYCIAVGSTSLTHNGLKQGYVKLTMRCNSPYSYSPKITSTVYSFTNNSLGSTVTISNNGDLTIYPEIWITKRSSGDVIIKSDKMASDWEFKFTGLGDGEQLYIDNEGQYIDTGLANVYRYSSFNDNYLKLLTGDNTLTVFGDCDVQFRYEYKLLV
jgi:phage-related protein